MTLYLQWRLDGPIVEIDVGPDAHTWSTHDGERPVIFLFTGQDTPDGEAPVAAIQISP